VRRTDKFIVITLAAILVLGLSNIYWAYTANPVSNSSIQPGTQTETAFYTIFKEGSTVYAKDGDTGRIVTSSTNASAVFHYATTHLPTNGGTIFVKAGNYSLTKSINLSTSNTVLEGEGFGTILFLAAGSNTDVISIIGGASNCKVRNLLIDGNKAGNPTGGFGIHVTCGRLHELRSLILQNVKTVGILSVASGVHLTDILVNYTDGPGFYFANASDIVMDGLVSNKNVIGFKIENCAGVMADTCIARNNDQNNGGYPGWYLFQVYNSTFTGCQGTDTQGAPTQDDGVRMTQVKYTTIQGWILKGNAKNGIYLTNSSYNQIINNQFLENGGYGVNLTDTLCNENVVKYNKYSGNTLGLLNDNSGGDTAFHEVYIPVANATTHISDYPARSLADAVKSSAYFTAKAPKEYQAVMRAYIVVVSTGTGNLYATLNASYAAPGEVYTTHQSGIGPTTYAITANKITLIDVKSLLTSFDWPDVLGISINRLGGDANDTLEANLYVIGLWIEYI